MKNIIFIFILALYGCATKYVLPGNRFVTPETQGGALHGQFEAQKTSANQLAAKLDSNDLVDGVEVTETSRNGFLVSTSFFNSFDFLLSHTGSGNALLGGKFQILGASRTEKGAGQKLAIVAAFGGNRYETDDKSVEFNLTGKEYMVLYGYRFNEFVLLYSNFSYSSYNFDGSIKSGRGAGQSPNFTTVMNGLYAGAELSYGAVFFKAESGYQQLKTTDTADFTHTITGFSIGLSW
jgi:hypothetical protein